MNSLALHAIIESAQSMAQTPVESVFNALPEGLLVALFAWVLLRLLHRQNSGTRFAIWFMALLMVAVLPLLGGIGSQGETLAPGMAWGHLHPAITVPGSWALFAFIAWALGTCVAMLRLAIGLWHLRQLRSKCQAIGAAHLDPSVRKTIEALCAASDGSKALTVATSELVRVPSAIGFWNRTIILPAWALRELPPEDLNVILLHEFAHLRRGDDWTNLVQKIVRAIFFFHPAVWWIESRLAVEREMACDDAVLAETSNPHGYASCLVSLLEKSMAHRLEQKHLVQKRWSMAQAVVDRAREASLRLARILDLNRPPATRVWKPALGIVGVFSMLCLVILPHGPRLIAFDRGIRANSHQSYTAAIRQPAPLFPASTIGDNTRLSITRSHAVARHQLARAPAVAARWYGNSDARRNSNSTVNMPSTALVRVSSIPDQEFTQRLQTLVFIEASQYVTSGSPVWRVEIWQVTFVSTVNQRRANAPVANSI